MLVIYLMNYYGHMVRYLLFSDEFQQILKLVIMMIIILITMIIIISICIEYIQWFCALYNIFIKNSIIIKLE